MAVDVLPISKEDPCSVEGKLCMCKVCECGMHKCPAKHTSSSIHYPPDTKSEYSCMYPLWPIPKRTIPRPSAAPETEHAKFIGITTQKADYSPKKIPDKYRHVKPDKTLDQCIPKGDYNNLASEYASRYEAKPIQARTPPKKPEANCHNSGAKFEGITTQKSDFRQWPTKLRVAAIKPIEAGNNMTGAFDDITTYKLAYWDKSSDMKRPLMRPESKELPSSGPFYGETTNHADYGPKSIPKRVPPMKHESSLGTCQTKFNAKSSYQHNYRAWEVQRPLRGEAMKGNLGIEQASKLSSETTYGINFKAPKLPKLCPVLLRGPAQKVVGDHLVY